MALTAVTPVNINPAGGAGVAAPLGNQSFSITQVQCDSSYPTGGWSLPITSLSGLRNAVLAAWCEIVTTTGSNCAAANFTYNKATQKLQAFTSVGVEVASAVNLSGLTVQVFAIGY